MDAFGYLAAVFIGIMLGLIGGGGSILTLPVLVYLFHVEKVQATAYSLFIVGITSLAGSMQYINKQLVAWNIALWFGVPSIVAVFAARKWILPAIPESWSWAGYTYEKGGFIMVLFGAIMLVAAWFMLFKNEKSLDSSHTNLKPKYFIISTLLEGATVGTITGIVGAGGGFMIIPALVILGNLNMRTAIGTSLVIIAVKSLIGLTGESIVHFDWPLLLKVSAMALVGMGLGLYLNPKVNNVQLKKAFGWFVVVMAFYMLFRELF